MYAQTLSVVRPKFTRPHLWIRRIVPTKNAMVEQAQSPEPQQHDVERGFPAVKALASYKMVQKCIFLLHDSLKLDLPEDVVEVIDYVLDEFEAYTRWMCVTLGDVEKQAKFTQHMLSQIDKALSVVSATMTQKKKDEDCVVDGCTKAVCA